jgi:hypothetical protein
MIRVKASELYRISDGLNIEGGDPYKRISKDHTNGRKFLWVNLIVVLDRPLIDNVLFETIFNDNRFPLLENRIDNLNEHRFMAATLLIMQYYVQNCRELLHRSNSKPIKITVHVHQDPAMMELCRLINMHLCMLIDIPDGVEIEYLTDNPTYDMTDTNYTETDILISLSQCAGLSPIHEPGTLYISDVFVPFQTKGFININKQYKVKNDLIRRLGKILRSEFHLRTIHYVNQHYKSYNPLKQNHKTKILTKNDFVRTPILQVDGLWNPTDKNQIILVE